MAILDLRKIARSQGKYGRVKTVLSEYDIPMDTSREEKQFLLWSDLAWG